MKCVSECGKVNVLSKGSRREEAFGKSLDALVGGQQPEAPAGFSHCVSFVAPTRPSSTPALPRQRHSCPARASAAVHTREAAGRPVARAMEPTVGGVVAEPKGALDRRGCQKRSPRRRLGPPRPTRQGGEVGEAVLPRLRPCEVVVAVQQHCTRRSRARLCWTETGPGKRHGEGSLGSPGGCFRVTGCGFYRQRALPIGVLPQGAPVVYDDDDGMVLRSLSAVRLFVDCHNHSSTPLLGARLTQQVPTPSCPSAT